MNKQEWIDKMSKIHQTEEDEFKGEYNSPELMWDKVVSKISSSPMLSADADIIPFGMWLTGHDKETIKQMYRDWH